ncbi:uncharacterized protein LOC124256654 [Haliotis rubra]|uniref:uncharacterized protein LOC124256654 n=1 Tax=Haliotis rubra TaxID=36100 RepID=UPI001EE57C72|nr:uncharacterized protein LOC124256654 [Haliotis rubra]
MTATLILLCLLILPACLLQYVGAEQRIHLDVERRRWTRTVDDVTTARESARFSRDNEYIQLFSLIRRPKKVHIHSAFSVYDYKDELAAARLRLNHTHVCVVFPVTNFTAAINTIWNRNMDENVETPDDDVKYIMKTDSKMTDAELESFKSKSPILYQICQGRRKTRIAIIDETETVTDEDVSQLKNVTFLSIYGKVSLYLKPTLSL